MADQNDFATAIGALIKSARWVQRNLVAGEDANSLREPGLYYNAPYAVSSTIQNSAYTGTGAFIVYPAHEMGTTATRYVIQEQIVGASAAGLPVRRSNRSLLGDGTWSPWTAVGSGGGDGPSDPGDYVTTAELDTALDGVSWVKRDLTTGEDMNALVTPGEYQAGWTVSGTLANGYLTGTGLYIVHRVSESSSSSTYLIQERLITSSADGRPVRRATRSLLSGGWTPWIADTDAVDAAIDDGLSSMQAYVDARVAPATSSPTRITAFGDSQTDGGANGTLWPEEESWPAHLGATLGAGFTVTNAGFSGATADELAMLVGALPVRVNVPSTLPHNGSVDVEPLAVYGLGVSGTGTRTLDFRVNDKNVRVIARVDRWTLYNWTGVTIPAGPLTLDPVQGFRGLAGDTAIIWVGGNDRTFGVTGAEATTADHVIAGIQRLIDWLTPQRKRFLLLGMQPRSTEPIGHPNHDLIVEVNTRLQALFPGRFRSVLTYLQTDVFADLALTPTQADMDAITQGLIPPAFMASGDITHINKTAAGAIGQHFVPRLLRQQGWL